MTHFREFFDSEYAGVWDLGGRDRIVTIRRVRAGQVGGHQGKQKSKKAILTLAELDKPMACNVTNAQTIAGMYGSDTREWVGKRITLYPTTTKFGKDTVECIRVRPSIPKGKPEHVGSQPVDPEARRQQNEAAGRASPGQAIADATTGQELLDAIQSCAAWIQSRHEDAWPRVLKRCEDLDVAADEAVLAMSAGVKEGS
ncbi:MAG: hypothetical protein AAGF12_37020 [Myxococcota bacterium]